MSHTRVVCEVKDVEPYNLFTAIKNRKKVKEVRVVLKETEDGKPSKWETFLPNNLEKPGKTFSLLIHNGKGDMVEYLVRYSTLHLSFETMLYAEGHESCIPGSTYDSALSLYKSFYKNPSNIKYVIPIHLDREIEITQDALEQYKREVKK